MDRSAFILFLSIAFLVPQASLARDLVDRSPEDLRNICKTIETDWTAPILPATSGNPDASLILSSGESFSDVCARKMNLTEIDQLTENLMNSCDKKIAAQYQKVVKENEWSPYGIVPQVIEAEKIRDTLSARCKERKARASGVIHGVRAMEASKSCKFIDTLSPAAAPTEPTYRSSALKD